MIAHEILEIVELGLEVGGWNRVQVGSHTRLVKFDKQKGWWISKDPADPLVVVTNVNRLVAIGLSLYQPEGDE